MLIYPRNDCRTARSVLLLHPSVCLKKYFPFFLSFFYLLILIFYIHSFLSCPSLFYISFFLPFVACSLLFSIFSKTLLLPAPLFFSLAPDLPSVFVLPLCSIYSQRGGRGTRPAEIKVDSFFMSVVKKKQYTERERGRYPRKKVFWGKSAQSGCVGVRQHALKDLELRMEKKNNLKFKRKF